MKVHELKILPEYFDAVISGDKRFEFRKNDRDFHVFDILRLKEWDWDKYTGREIDVEVRFVLQQFPGMERGYCVMSIIPLTAERNGKVTGNESACSL